MKLYRRFLRFFKTLSLQKRISLLVLTGLVIGLGLFSWLGIQSLNDNTAKVLDERLIIAKIMASELDDMLGHVLVHLEEVAQTPDGTLPDGAAFVDLVQTVEQSLSDSGIPLVCIMLTDAGGHVVQAMPLAPDIDVESLAQQPGAALALTATKPVVSNLVVNQANSMGIVLAAVPFTDGQGRVIGSLTTGIDIADSRIQTFGEAVNIGETGYVEVVDGNGIVMARTDPGQPLNTLEKSDHPGKFAELIIEGRPTVGTCHRCHEANQQVQRRRDVLAFAPLSVASWGVAIRQAEEEALAPTQQLERRLFILGIVVLVGTFVIIWTMMQGIVRPVKLLTASARKVAAGDFTTMTPVKRSDEVGQLTQAFNSMTKELATSHDALTARNEDLAALNSIAATVNQSLDLHEILDTSLEKVLEVTRTASGCIMLVNQDTGRLEKVSSVGEAVDFQCPETGHASGSCACYRAMQGGRPIMVMDADQCPLLVEDRESRAENFVSVPLKSKNRTLGIMNVASPRERPMTEDDLRLLDSISYHIGLAVENSYLYEESRQKEELRGRLFTSVITAQEEERKRIARELHDEYGQTMAGLMLSLETAESQVSPPQSKLIETLEKAKTLVVRGIRDIRRLTFNLRPSVLDDLGLVSALQAYVDDYLAPSGIEAHIESRNIKGKLPPSVETALFRIVQEAITNIVKHAEAKHVNILLRASREMTTAVIKDDGKGFDPDAVFKTRTKTHSLGLLGIQERVALLGGRFSITSAASQGTELRIEIPATQPVPEDEAS